MQKFYSPILLSRKPYRWVIIEVEAPDVLSITPTQLAEAWPAPCIHRFSFTREVPCVDAMSAVDRGMCAAGVGFGQ